MKVFFISLVSVVGMTMVEGSEALLDPNLGTWMASRLGAASKPNTPKQEPLEVPREPEELTLDGDDNTPPRTPIAWHLLSEECNGEGRDGKNAPPVPDKQDSND